MENVIKLIVIDLDGKKHQIEAPTDLNLNLMEAIKMHELQIKATCKGMSLCASCNVIVQSDHPLPSMKESEEEMLDEAFVLNVPGSRLSCQIPINHDIDGLIVQLGNLTAE